MSEPFDVAPQAANIKNSAIKIQEEAIHVHQTPSNVETISRISFGKTASSQADKMKFSNLPSNPTGHTPNEHIRSDFLHPTITEE